MEDQPNFIVDIYSLMSKQNILLSYLGEITPDITNNLLQLLNKSKMFDEEIATKKKLYNIMVECLENITRHNEVIEKAIHPAIFLLVKSASHYHIITGNYIYNKTIDPIKDALDSINKLDRAEIKKMHLKALENSKISEKGGAGIGLIDIALKSGNELLYAFIPVDNAISFYTLDAKVTIQ